MKLLACNSNIPLAEAMASYIGCPLARASVRRFSDMEVFVEIHENVRGEDVFVVQSTSFPANDHLMELLVTCDALRRSSARRITVVTQGRNARAQRLYQRAGFVTESVRLWFHRWFDRRGNPPAYSRGGIE